MPRVSPEVLRWARETSGLSPAAAAKKLGLRDSKKGTAVERIARLEQGLEEPSRPLLLKMAAHYRRPLIALYLAAPPLKGDRGRDFRTVREGSDRAGEYLLDALLRDIHSRQALLRSALEDEEPNFRVKLVGSLTKARGVRATVETIARALGDPRRAFRGAADADAAFKLLRERVEALGVFVVLLGDLGSHHSALSPDVFRGFALADPIAPFVVINDHDSHAAWSFSLIHELTHLVLGQTGVSGISGDGPIERFCNEVAAEFIMPLAELRQLFQSRSSQATALDDWIRATSTATNVSRTMLAFRLFKADLIRESQWAKLRDTYRAQWLAQRETQRESRRAREGGPDYYVVRRQRLGAGLLRTAGRLLASGTLTTAKTARVLGVKPTQVEPLLPRTSGKS